MRSSKIIQEQPQMLLWHGSPRASAICTGMFLSAASSPFLPARCRQAEAEALAHMLPRAAALLSITVPANRTMRRLFARRGFRQQRRVVAWPETPVALAAHERMAAAAAQQQQAQRAQQREQQQEQQARQQQDLSQPPLSFLQSLLAAAAVVDTPAARALLPSWRRCSSVAELQAVLLRLRQGDPQRQQQHGSEAEDDGSAAALGAEEDLASVSAGAAAGDEAAAHQTPAAVQAEVATAAAAPAVQEAAGAGQLPADLPADSCAFHWVPGEYELLPAGGPAVQQQVQEGAVWLLEVPSGAASPASEAGSAAGATAGTAGTAVLVCFGPGFRGMRHAGIVAGSPAALESALLHASVVADPRCCRCGGLLGVG